MDNWFRSVWFIRIVSLMLAGLLWVTVNVDDNLDSDSLWLNDSSSEMEVMTGIPVEIQLDSEDYVVSGVPQEVTVAVEGPTSVLAPVVRQENFTVFVNLDELGPGTHEVSLQHTGISNRLSVNIDPKTVEVTIEEKVSQDYDVHADYINEDQISNEYDLGEAEIDPGKVTITGSESVLERVASVKTIIDVDSTSSTINNAEVPVKVYDSQGNELNVLVDPSTVHVTVPVTRPKKSVPIDITAKGGAPNGVVVSSVSTETEEVTIYGPRDVIESIESLSEIPVDITEINEDQTVDVELSAPEGVMEIEPKAIKVQIDVDDPDES